MTGNNLKITNQQEFNRNPISEATTWAHLYTLIPYDDNRDTGLWATIDTARMNGNHYVAAVLDEVANELIKIAVECFDKQGVTPSLWPALYRFRMTTLKPKLYAAIAEKNDVLIEGLKNVYDPLNGILDIDRDKWDIAKLDEDIARTAEQLSPAAKDKEGKVTSHGCDAKPWLIANPNDPEPAQDWYVAARYLARKLVKDDSTLLVKKNLLAGKVSVSLAGVGIFKRGGKFPIASTTILKAFVNVALN